MKFFKPLYAILFLTLISSSGYSNTLQFGIGLMRSSTNSTIPDYSGIESRLMYKAQDRLAINVNMGLSTICFKESSDFQHTVTGYFSAEYLKSSKTKLLSGDFRMIWFEVSPVFFIAQGVTKNKVDVYCGAGFGLYYAENNWNWLTYTNLQASEKELGFRYYEDKPGLSMGMNAFMGIRIPMTANASLNLEGKYIYNHTDIEYTLHYPEQKYSDSGNRKLDLSSIVGSIALMINI